jgi:hypothetical protein
VSNFLSNIKKATEKTIKSIAADVTVRDSRLDICNQCEHLLQVTSQCSKCGCFVKAKTWFSGSSCPINKW